MTIDSGIFKEEAERDACPSRLAVFYSIWWVCAKIINEKRLNTTKHVLPNLFIYFKLRIRLK